MRGFKAWCLEEAIQIRMGDDDSEAASGAAYVFDDAGLRWTRDKELLLVAVDSDTQSEEIEASDVVGAVVYSWGPDRESENEDHWVFDFDVAVRQDYQNKPSLRVGTSMIDAALSQYRSLAAEASSSEIRIYAVNPILVKFLTSPRYGFRIEDELPGGKAILSRR